MYGINPEIRLPAYVNEKTRTECLTMYGINLEIRLPAYVMKK